MPINLEIGVERTMLATLVGSGVSSEAARARVTAPKLAAGVAYVRAQFKEKQGSSPEEQGRSWQQAFQALKAWTLANA